VGMVAARAPVRPSRKKAAASATAPIWRNALMPVTVSPGGRALRDRRPRHEDGRGGGRVLRPPDGPGDFSPGWDGV